MNDFADRAFNYVKKKYDIELVLKKSLSYPGQSYISKKGGWVHNQSQYLTGDTEDFEIKLYEAINNTLRLEGVIG